MLYALTNDDREPFFGEPLVGFADRIAHQFEIDRRIWILSATPRDGWGSLIRGQMSLFVVIYAGVSAMILIIVLLALQRADWLEQRVVHKELEAQLAGQRERQHLARELHDSISQILYAIGLSARTLESHAEGEAISSQDVGDIAATISELAEGSLSELRTLILGLHPEVFARIGLNGALEQLAEAIQNRHQIHVELSIISEPDIGLNEKMALFRIAQEAAQNAIKHAQPNLISLTTRHRENGKFTLQIADTGIGFEVNEDFPGHLGLQSMQERAQIIGARFTIRSRLKEGTRITIELS
jgi:signal transduction histidine kinase